MYYRILADLILCTHVAFILFVVFGGFAGWRWRWVPWIHLPAAAWGALVELAGWYCPLTSLENHFLEVSGAAGYEGSFIEEYLLPILYPADLTRPIQVGLGMAVLAVNAVAYGWLWRRGGRR